MQCKADSCKRVATCVPVVLIPAKNMPEELMPDARVVVPMPMCNRCIAKVRLEDYLDENMRKQVLSANRNRLEMNLSKARIDKMKCPPKQLEEILKHNGGIYAANPRSQEAPAGTAG